MNRWVVAIALWSWAAPMAAWAGITMDIEVHEIATDALGTDIEWKQVSLPNTWVLANHYLRINANFTSDVRGGIQIYTDNTAPDAGPYRVTQVRPVTGWLVDGVTRKTGLPFAWLIKNIKEAPSSAFTPDWGFFFYVKDKAQEGFVNGETYINPIIDYCSTQGTSCFQWDNGKYAAGNLPFYMYFEADFTAAVTPRTYSTPTIRLEAYSF